MKKRLHAPMALCLVVALLLTGCGVVDFGGYFSGLADYFGSFGTVAFENMEYERPDIEDFRAKRDALYEALQEQKIGPVVNALNAMMESYYHIATAYALANIYYSKDLTDETWKQEYDFCMALIPEVETAVRKLLYDLADSPMREQLESPMYFGEGYFDAFGGTDFYDETFSDLLAQEAELISRYYAISGEAAGMDSYSDAFFTTYGEELGELYVSLVKVRNQMARHAGYEDYASFIYAFDYQRDYTPRQATALLDDIQKELVPVYTRLNAERLAVLNNTMSTEQETFEYVRQLANTLGGWPEDALELMEQANLYDISMSENKFNASFEVFLVDYLQPYVFVNPTGLVQDKLTFAHEFGHFCNDYASGGRGASIDVAEVFSQGMEYLSLRVLQNNEDLQTLKMAQSLQVFVEQAAYASFEHQVYALDEKDLTAEKVQKLYEATGTEFGFTRWNWDSRDYVLVTHFFIAPMYIMSYVVSNDGAMQIYDLERTTPGAGQELYLSQLNTQAIGYMAFTQSAGLQSPFRSGAMAGWRALFEELVPLVAEQSS